MQGAGGMVMIDPAFQQALARHCQQNNIPVILDEVFSGIWRLGRLSAAHMLGIKPDIACYAKLLTGDDCAPSDFCGLKADSPHGQVSTSNAWR